MSKASSEPGETRAAGTGMPSGDVWKGDEHVRLARARRLGHVPDAWGATGLRAAERGGGHFTETGPGSRPETDGRASRGSGAREQADVSGLQRARRLGHRIDSRHLEPLQRSSKSGDLPAELGGGGGSEEGEKEEQEASRTTGSAPTPTGEAPEESALGLDAAFAATLRATREKDAERRETREQLAELEAKLEPAKIQEAWEDRAQWLTGHFRGKADRERARQQFKKELKKDLAKKIATLKKKLEQLSKMGPPPASTLQFSTPSAPPPSTPEPSPTPVDLAALVASSYSAPPVAGTGVPGSAQSQTEAFDFDELFAPKPSAQPMTSAELGEMFGSLTLPPTTTTTTTTSTTSSGVAPSSSPSGGAVTSSGASGFPSTPSESSAPGGYEYGQDVFEFLAREQSRSEKAAKKGEKSGAVPARATSTTSTAESASLDEIFGITAPAPPAPSGQLDLRRVGVLDNKKILDFLNFLKSKGFDYKVGSGGNHAKISIPEERGGGSVALPTHGAQGTLKAILGELQVTQIEVDEFFGGKPSAPPVDLLSFQ